MGQLLCSCCTSQALHIGKAKIVYVALLECASWVPLQLESPSYITIHLLDLASRLLIIRKAHIDHIAPLECASRVSPPLGSPNCLLLQLLDLASRPLKLFMTPPLILRLPSVFILRKGLHHNAAVARGGGLLGGYR